MKRTEVLQEARKMRFGELYESSKERRLTQEKADRVVGVSDRTFRRYLNRCEEEGMEGLVDHRLGQVSHRCAPVDEVISQSELYHGRYQGFSTENYLGKVPF